MNITFEATNECICYQELVANETDRKAIKKFTRHFGNAVLGAVLKTHKKLKIAENARIYNNTVSFDNRIGKKNGVKDKDPLILKVRIQDAYRKFFYFVIRTTDETQYFCLSENWEGQFDEVKDIHVFEINKHDYKSVK
jgi:hypothetical protein